MAGSNPPHSVVLKIDIVCECLTSKRFKLQSIEEYARAVSVDWGFARKLGERERGEFGAPRLFLHHVVLASHTFELHFYLKVVTECSNFCFPK